ncbi:MAG: class B sortase [Lachnospiraceae bacterium]|nr:class B sortase [Lachnospiraceae bacterium]
MQLEASMEEYRPVIAEKLEPTQAPATMPTPESITLPPAETLPPPATEVPPAPTAEPTPEPVPNPYAESYLANEDMAGWLVIPGMVIDYPIMWTPEDENYYLRRGFDKKKLSAGCLILDTDSCVDPLSTNLIIHGHNMKAGTMFGTLEKYKNEDFYQEHKQIILHTKECQRNYEVIAVFRSQVYKKSDKVFKFYKFFQANTEEEFNDFYDNIKAMSLYDTGVTATFGDRFITLSTCSYHVDNGRFVVVAKEVAPGDTYLTVEESLAPQ